MPKNIVILSDGTGQAGGLLFDENRSNIYKLYRATRVGPDSCIDPDQQVAYYDAGLGSRPPSGGWLWSAYRILHNFFSQATGYGLTTNIIDCYQMIIRLCRPGDRIFLFGFSRGAYTARCLGGVLSLCGVPRQLGPGQVMEYDSTTTRRLAKTAVKKVYQHTASWDPSRATARQQELLAQRRELARQFREAHGVNLDDKSNYPYFIGVFDTVAAVARRGATLLLILGAIILAILLSFLLWGFYPSYTPLFGNALGNLLSLIFGLVGLRTAEWWHWLVVVSGLMAIVILIAYLLQATKFAPSADRSRWWRTLTISLGRMQFEDKNLNDNVKYARHAIAIDEQRAVFARVGWGDPKSTRPFQDDQGMVTFKQYWFPGNHSDIGGSYSENESRLSDIALAWMVDDATAIKDGLKIDPSVLHLYPASDGPQHDEVRRGFPVITKFFGITWRIRPRNVPNDATLHKSVYDRFNFPQVLQEGHMVPYRPEPLASHTKLAHLYRETIVT
jgi:uncharacterized protein (DUF2235 family)